MNNHSTGIAHIEAEMSKIEELITKMDDNIDETNNKIGESMKKIEELSVNKPGNETKQCVYDRKDYCKEEGNCKYVHADETCNAYIET